MPGAIPAVPVADTLKRGARRTIVETVPRAGLFRAQTPQAFPFPLLLALHRAGPGGRHRRRRHPGGRPATRSRWWPASEDNIKLTYKEDLVRLERMLRVR